MEERQDLSDKEQFKRIKLLLKEENFRKLLDASVTIVGVGAVGGYVLEALARAGIGKITIIDHDIVSKSNINRQIVALNSTVGRKKVMVAKERVLDINPDCEITAVDMFVNKDTVKSVFDLKSDIIIDAIDSLNPKFELLKMAIETGTPIISSMGAALKRNPENIKIGLLKDTKNCPLAKMIRKKFAKIDIKPKIPCVYSDEVIDKEDMAIIIPNENDQLAEGRVRNIMGSLPTITGIFGLFIANYVINYLIKK